MWRLKGQGLKLEQVACGLIQVAHYTLVASTLSGFQEVGGDSVGTYDALWDLHRTCFLQEKDTFN